MKKISILLISFLWSSTLLFAQEAGGMWIPTELNETEMKAMGMQISAQEIFDTDQPSIKDAIARFGGGCTSEVISPNGLLLTNHHCGYAQIQSHSSVKNDYLKNGFWAKNQKEELPNKGLTATFTVAIEEVTDAVLQGVTAVMSEEERQNRVKDNIEILIKNTVKEDYQDTEIKAFYKGNKYYQFITETFRDIRLVGAPPSAIGKFGADTDNWSWPRHVGDFALFRIYANRENKPAEYSENNVPYTPKHFLSLSNSGIQEDDFTFVFGFPGTTDEYLPAIALEQTLKITNPHRIAIRDIALKILDKKMRKDNETRIKYASKYAGISNYHKKWTGESLGLEKTNAVQQRKDYEKDFQKKINENPEWKNNYQNLLATFEKLYTEKEKYELAEIYFDEAIYRNSESFRIALLLANLLQAHEIGENTYKKYKDLYTKNLKSIYKNYDAELDKEVSLALIKKYKEEVPDELTATSITITPLTFQNSVIGGEIEVNGTKFTEAVEKAMENDEILIEYLKKDPLIKEISKIRDAYITHVSEKYLAIQNQLSQLQRQYMKAQMEVFPERNFFPDANSTLRVTYGKIDGYQPDNQSRYNAFTYLDEAVEKYIPGDYEFDMPEKLRQLQRKKKFGKYGVGKGKKARMPVNFIATNHTTGGNSGSPVLDKNGNLIGLNFDRVWEGTMSDLYYDPEICRNIMVDVRYILFIIEKYAGAKYLLQELQIIN